ncbi:nuclear transport factor 2 family protein [Kineococcus sp. SYSU DK003]|uniref:nuclear transport factor 2 family protein n=1 Tax=Kineococcus sp. SYSU DK003 TaxID=3383124 RepID=UPI003D7ED6AC
MNTSTTLPTTIGAFLAAHGAREAEAAVRTFAPGAVVVDEGNTYRGPEQLLDFLRHAGT